MPWRLLPQNLIVWTVGCIGAHRAAWLLYCWRELWGPTSHCPQAAPRLLTALPSLPLRPSRVQMAPQGACWQQPHLACSPRCLRCAMAVSPRNKWCSSAANGAAAQQEAMHRQGYSMLHSAGAAAASAGLAAASIWCSRMPVATLTLSESTSCLPPACTPPSGRFISIATMLVHERSTVVRRP